MDILHYIRGVAVARHGDIDFFFAWLGETAVVVPLDNTSDLTTAVASSLERAVMQKFVDRTSFVRSLIDSPHVSVRLGVAACENDPEILGLLAADGERDVSALAEQRLGERVC